MLNCSIRFSASSFWMGDGLESHCGSQDHHPSKNSAQRTICCNSTSNVPVDGRMYPKNVELRIQQYNYLVASSWHFTLFHEEDARSNNTYRYLLFILFNQCDNVSKHLIQVPSTKYHENTSDYSSLFRTDRWA